MNHKQLQIQVHGGKEAHPPSDAPEFQESLLRFKRRIYLATVLLGFVVCLLCLGFLEWSGNTQLRLRLILMLALSFEVIVAAILLRSVRWIPVAESLLYVLAASTLLLNWYLDLAAPHNSLAEASRAAIDLAMWSPIIYILAFVALPSRRSVTWGLLFLAGTLILGFGHFAYIAHDGPIVTMELYFLVRYGLAGITCMVLLSVGARLNERYVRTRIEAEAMARLAHTDPMINIANRRHLYAHFEQEMERARRYGRPVSLLMFDMDRFKQVNDTFGHDLGDEVLTQVAAAVTRGLRKGDQFGRWGGEEFMILAPETTEAQAAQMAERLRAAIEALRLRQVGHVTASFGVAGYAPGMSLEVWLQRADQALYSAKANGRNQVEIAGGRAGDPQVLSAAGESPEVKPEQRS